MIKKMGRDWHYSIRASEQRMHAVMYAVEHKEAVCHEKHA